MKKHWMMVLHSVIIGTIICLFMIFVLGQQNEDAERKSILIASVGLILFDIIWTRITTKVK